MVLLLTTALASDGVRELSFEEVFDQSAVVALARIADPAVERRAFEVPLATTPARTLSWTTSVQRFEVLEVLHRRAGPPLTGSFEAVGPSARRDLDRHVTYEVQGRSRGIMHERYAGELASKEQTAGQTVVVFLGAPRAAGDDPVGKAWTTAVGPAWTVLGMDTPAIRERVEKRAAAR